MVGDETVPLMQGVDPKTVRRLLPDEEGHLLIAQLASAAGRPSI